MSSKKAITLFVSFSAVVLLAIAAFSYAVDPLCYYRCDDVIAERKNLNNYYRNLQRVLRYNDTELLVLGSSRGESLPLAWLAEDHGLKALNLSVGGADVHAKGAFLGFALRHLRLKKVIWIADYFELIDENMSAKVTLTPAVRALAFKGRAPARALEFRRLSTLIEHNTIEAAFSLLRGKKTNWPPDRGENSNLDLAQCEKSINDAKLSTMKLLKEVGIIYDGYAGRILVPEQNPQSFIRLRGIAEDLTTRGIDLVIVIPPYHPEFMRRLAAEHPQIMARHAFWIKQLQTLASARTEVRNFFFDGRFAAESTRYWTDGVHFNCAAAAEMLRRKSN
jgi:hypothetical protein